MTTGIMKDSISKKELEHWLTQVFTPVEPNEIFIRRLKARLMKYRGNRLFSIWMVIGVLAMAAMILLTWFGFLLRILLLVTGLFIDRRRHTHREKRLSAAGG
jgi:fatty acid desaturase